MTNDPCIMYKHSLDELPRLFNGLGGSTSLVGQRPSSSAEEANYSEVAHRLFLARPVIAGARQMMGRPALSREESVRPDLDYIEKWSFGGQASASVRTIRALAIPGKAVH